MDFDIRCPFCGGFLFMERVSKTEAGETKVEEGSCSKCRRRYSWVLDLDKKLPKNLTMIG